MAGALLLALLAKFILLLFTNEKYLSANVVMGILAFNVIISGVVQVVSLANLLAKDNRPIAKAAMFSVIITVAGYFALIPFSGKEGAALAVAAGNLAITLYVTIKAQKLYFIPYNFKKIISYSGVLILVYLIYLSVF